MLDAGYTVVPQVLAGAGMGLALPAYAGELLPERTSTDAAYGLLARHVGIVLILAILAPVVSNRLDDLTDQAVLKGAALVLDAQIDPLQKLALAPALFGNVDADRPRAALQDAVDQHRAQFADDAEVYDRLATARRDRLGEIFAEWTPEKRAEVADVLRQLARELVPDGRHTLREGSSHG